MGLCLVPESIDGVLLGGGPSPSSPTKTPPHPAYPTPPPSKKPSAAQVPYYEYALDMILDNEPPQDVSLTDQQHEMLENAAEMLYGLIHARYLVTARGLSAMMEKFKNCDFGRCPRWGWGWGCACVLRLLCGARRVCDHTH